MAASPAACGASPWRVHLMRFVWRFPPVHSNGKSGIGATGFCAQQPNRQRVGASEGIGNHAENHALPGRVIMTSSTRPYSTACLLVMNKSRSVSFSTFLRL